MPEPPSTDSPDDHAQAGGVGKGAVAGTRLGAVPPLIKFSTFNTLSGGKLDLNERPLQIVRDTLDDKYLAYDIPADTSLPDWMQACSKVEIEGYSFVSVNTRAKVGILSFGTDEDLARVEAATIFVKGKPVQRKRIQSYKDTLAHVYIYDFDADSLEGLTKDFYEALSLYGVVLDIEFEVSGSSVLARAKALVDMTVARIPGCVDIRGRRLGLSGKKVGLFCRYCREPGHHKKSCPKTKKKKKL
ncbi:hypothetical protein GGH91_000649 [Coemansia sp. RSA 2671]|nr:hypothetical protein LPJ60_001294 [Coemansia sp. RSA 2675]KAJ2349713.1 hypothetical protein GGH91_000649 [Coemansia sp. RSA 2671]